MLNDMQSNFQMTQILRYIDIFVIILLTNLHPHAVKSWRQSA